MPAHATLESPTADGPVSRRFWRREDGMVGGAEALVFGVLVFVFGTLIVVNGWAVVDAKFATNAAAREAVRAVVEAPAGSSGHALQQLARNAAHQAVVAHGHDQVAVASSPGVLTQTRCAPVSITASVEVRSTILPGITGPSLYNVSSTHEEVIDPFRSGLAAVEGELCGF